MRAKETFYIINLKVFIFFNMFVWKYLNSFKFTSVILLKTVISLNLNDFEKKTVSPYGVLKHSSEKV